MDISLFTEFTMVAKHRNLSEASKELHVAESVLSRHLATFESTYGITLFDRSRSPMELTPTGRKALEIASRIGNEEERLRQLHAFEHQHVRAIRVIGTIDAPLLARLRQASQKLDFMLDFDTTSTQTPFDQLRNDNADIAIEPISELIDTHGLEWKIILREHASLVLERTNPLAAHDSFALEDLTSLNFTSLLTNSGNALRKHLQSLCQHAGILGSLPGYLTLSQATTYDHLFMYGLNGSVVMLPESMAKRYASDYASDYVERPFADSKADYIFCVFYKNKQVFLKTFIDEISNKEG